MGILIDLFIILVIISTSYLGYRRGLTSVFYKIIAFILSLIIVIILYKPVSNYIIKNTQIDENIADTVRSVVPEDILIQDTQEEVLKDQIEETNISEGIVKMMTTYAEEAVAKAENNIADYVSVQIAYFIVRIGTMIILFTVSRVVLIVLRFATNIITSLPIISTIDKSGGLIYGVLKAFIVIYIVLAIISALSPIISSWGIIDVIQESHLGSIMYNNNFILNLIMK